jgi:hypothetical protein
MTNQDLKTDFIVKYNSLTKEMEELLSKYEDKSFENRENKWNPVQVLEHLSLVEAGILKFIKKEPLDTDEYAESILTIEPSKFNHVLIDKREVGLINAPATVMPQSAYNSTQEAFEVIKNNRNELIEILNNPSFEFTGLVREHARWGKMTKADWLNFSYYHSKRHLIQLEEAYN